MPLMAVMTWAFIWPALAAATPRSRYLKNSRRPGTSGEFCAVAWASVCPGLTREVSCPSVRSTMTISLTFSFGRARRFSCRSLDPLSYAVSGRRTTAAEGADVVTAAPGHAATGVLHGRREATSLQAMEEADAT